jgi:hypothetical protein
MVATPVSDDSQVTVVVMSLVVPSANVPWAVNCTVSPRPTVCAGAEMVSDVKREVVTVSVAVPVSEPDCAVMVLLPTATAVAKPPAVMVAVLVEEDAQVGEMLVVLPSSFTPAAVNCCVSPIAMLVLAGETLIDVSFGSWKKPWHETSTRRSTATTGAKRRCRQNMKLSRAGPCVAGGPLSGRILAPREINV